MGTCKILLNEPAYGGSPPPSGTTYQESLAEGVNAADGTAVYVNGTLVDSANVPGINAPANLVTVWPGYDGSELPGESTTGTVNVLNEFGSGAANQQIRTTTLVPDVGSLSGTALDIKFPAWNDPDWPLAFPNDSWGGQSPARFGYQMGLEGGGRDWQELYCRFESKWSSGWSQYGRYPSYNVLLTDVVANATTLTTITCTGVSWTTNQWAGKFVRKVGAQAVHKIVSNTSNELTVTPAYGYYLGTDISPIQIVEFSTGVNGWNVGTKWFFPRIACDAAGSGTVHGQAYNISLTNVGCEANFIAGVQSQDYEFGGTQFIDPNYNLQIHDWNGITTDGQGAIGVNGNISYGVVDTFGPYPFHTNLNLAFGQYHDIEIYLKLATPGVANGIMRTYVGGVLRLEHTAVPNVPTYIGTVVTVGGTDYTVPLTVSNPRWSYIWHDSTYGGGYHIPETECHQTIRAWYIGGKD